MVSAEADLFLFNPLNGIPRPKAIFHLSFSIFHWSFL